MLRLLKRRRDCDGHHWHVEPYGWSCCHCTDAWRAGKHTRPPESDTTVCVERGTAFDELQTWLHTVRSPVDPVAVGDVRRRFLLRRLRRA